MKPKYWLFLGAAAVGAVQVVACSSNFDSCTDSRTCAATAAGSGEGGAADEAEAGAAGSAAAPTNSDAGASGAPEASGPVLFGACSNSGEFACQYVASAQRLACNGSTWQPGTTCGTGELCDRTTGGCAKTIAECASAMPNQVVCRVDTPVTCGPDLVTVTAGAECAGHCDGGVCQAPVCGDKKVEPGEDCDDGETTTSGTCTKCKKAVCGDGFLLAGVEECDDGNTTAGDGCSPACAFEPIALAAGDTSTCALSKGGTVKCWGDNSAGQLGIESKVSHGDGSGGMGKELPTVSLGTHRTAKAISVGRNSACAVLDNGQLKCWGENLYGMLGQGDSGAGTERGDQAGEMGDALKPVQLGGGRTAVAVEQGGYHTCAVLDDGEAKCWGAGVLGELGLDDDIDRFSPPAAAINLGAKAVTINASNGDASCAILENGLTKCWGLADYGALSVDPSLNKGFGSVSRVAIGDYKGANAPAGEMVLLPGMTFGDGLKAKQIGLGFASACALLSNNTVKCWGSSLAGELGLGTGIGVKYGDIPSALAALPAINLGTGRTAKSIAVGSFNTCALLDEGSVKCWGLNTYGQLGVGSIDNKGDNPNEMGDYLKPVSFGNHKALQIVAGDQHNCALLDDATVVCWGYNAEGELGVNNRAPLGNQPGFVLTPVDLAF